MPCSSTCEMTLILKSLHDLLIDAVIKLSVEVQVTVTPTLYSSLIVKFQKMPENGKLDNTFPCNSFNLYACQSDVIHCYICTDYILPVGICISFLFVFSFPPPPY